MRKALLLGGGGFIGSNYYAAYAAAYDKVVIVDKFHGPSHSTLADHERLAASLRKQDRIFTADVAEIARWPELLREATDIFLLNADTGTGSSFAHPSMTVGENLARMSTLVEAIRSHCDASTTRIMFTSSRAVYGEGHWVCAEHGAQVPDRSNTALAAGRFAPTCPACGGGLALRGSAEDAPHRPLSVYGLTKSAGETLLRLTLCAAGFDVRIVRYQNVYGIGQAVDNPYTGVLNWFSRGLLEGKTVKVFEQGLIVRDFIFVSDAAALLHSLASASRGSGDTHSPMLVNGGTGVATPLGHAASVLRRLYGVSTEIHETDDYRQGDVLGAVADNHQADALLGFRAAITLEDGLAKYADWFRAQHATC